MTPEAAALITPDPFAELPLVFVLPHHTAVSIPRLAELRAHVSALEAAAEQRGLDWMKEYDPATGNITWTFAAPRKPRAAAILRG